MSIQIEIVNTYRPPAPPSPSDAAALLLPTPSYNANFVFPVRPLSSNKLALHPFIPALHLPLFQKHASVHPGMFAYLPFGPLPTLQSAAELYLKRVESDPHSTWFCVVDLTRPPATATDLSSEDNDDGSMSPSEIEKDWHGSFAGIIGLLSASASQSQAEIGYLLILPPYQRTHVTTHACSLLLLYLLDPPSRGGLGLRRVQWKANAANERSVRAAERLGFAREAVLRWAMVLPQGKEGLDPPPGEEGTGKGRHTVMLGLCWDDWEAGGREKVEALIRRER
ncbi:hypothetical protein CALCODRAFT_553136 [Calocera cornea HHB12733]|uniref:N-acetyltransferase domain-containing protein n=1 Tax=Calocera cornea HHB12733 TaxID=1353952 RepID=A0A165J5Z4_9BASI|nr:hypothetical protein CALCODRAFT_553136 [Calocera cornea HHB12733]